MFMTYPFKKEDAMYEKEREKIIFEQILRNRIEYLCRKGILKSYHDKEENLPYIRGRIMLRENIINNLILKQRIFCKYSDFGPDNQENRIIKFALYRLSKMKLEDLNLHKKIRLLLHYFESVTLPLLIEPELKKVTFNKLTKHYEPIINLSKLILSNSSLCLEKDGGIRSLHF